MATGKDLILKFRRQWQLMLWLKILLYALGPAMFFHFLFLHPFWSLVVFCLGILLGAAILRPWKLSLGKVSGHLDHKLEMAEYSSGLLLLATEELSGLAKLQQQRLARQLKGAGKVRPPVGLKKAVAFSLVLGLLGAAVHYYGLKENFSRKITKANDQEQVVFMEEDSTELNHNAPEIEQQRLTINYPAYTNLPSRTSSTMSVKAVEGSKLTWHLKFNARVDSVAMDLMGNRHLMTPLDDGYTRTVELTASGFYNFRFRDSLGESYVSDLYSIEVIEDRRPVVEIEDLEQFSSFEVDEEKTLTFNTQIRDDFGISEAVIIATVSRGSGESVKFREEQLDFETAFQRGAKELQLAKKMNLDSLQMEPGDELYFYVEVSDTKPMGPNIARSETFFAAIKDTLSDEFGVEGGMGVDLMPDYFRSQRQLIIDTEKLIKEKPELPKKEFEARSNGLAADQKALRLKYGQFMGDEAEEEEAVDHEQTSADEEDPLAAYSHAHDSENEHNLVADEHEEHEGEEADDPLKEYLHNHDDPEESTLFTESLKAKLRRALNIMWDSELHLRLYEPEKSLPYQYEALELLQEIKNSARIYVHRIGFDPPPIKEETRLTGEIDEVAPSQKVEELCKEDSHAAMREAVQVLEQLLQQAKEVSAEDQQLLEKAGAELAGKAIAEPGRYLKTLQALKKLSSESTPSKQILLKVQRGLLKALPPVEENMKGRAGFIGDLNELLLKELKQYD